MKNKFSFKCRFINAMTLGIIFFLHQNKTSGKCVRFTILVFSLGIPHLFFLGRPTTNIFRGKGKNLKGVPWPQLVLLLHALPVLFLTTEGLACMYANNRVGELRHAIWLQQ